MQTSKKARVIAAESLGRKPLEYAVKEVQQKLDGLLEGLNANQRVMSINVSEPQITWTNSRGGYDVATCAVTVQWDEESSAQ